MGNYLEENDVFELDGSNYVTLETLVQDGNHYAFVNKLEGEDTPTNQFDIFMSVPEGIREFSNLELKQKIAKEFEKKMNVRIKDMLLQYKAEGGE